MTWVTRSTFTAVTQMLDVGLSDFDGEQLLQGLINEQWISEAEAETIMARRRGVDPKKPLALPPTMTADELVTAREDLVAGRRFDALLHLERFLGREWSGVLVAGAS